MPKKTKSEIELAGQNTEGQSVQENVNPGIIELHQIKSHLEDLEARPDLLKPIHLQCIGSWYYHKHPTRTWFHTHHNHADDLLKVETGEPIDLWLKLADLIARLTNGQLSLKILDVYNSAFVKYGLNNELGNLRVIHYIPTKNPILKTTRQLSAEMTANISKCKKSILNDIKRQAIPSTHISEYQVIVKKSKFSSTQTAKALKVNTVNYAAKVLETTKPAFETKQRVLQKISSSRDILMVDDLKLIPDFPAERYETKETSGLLMKENLILASEKYNYIQLVHGILAKGNKADHRDILKIALGLKDFTENGCVVEGSVFEGHAKLLDAILANKRLLELVMVTCGKVLISGPSNDSLIELLMLRGISVNSVDEHGMTATHYALQNFYIYRKEPLDLVKKLLACGADLGLADQKGETPYRIAIRHGSKEIVHGGQTLVELIKTRVSSSASRNGIRSLLSTNLGFFRKLENEFLEEHRHDDPSLQREYDKRFGLVLRK